MMGQSATTQNYFFEADGVPASVVARDIAENFGVTVLVGPEFAERPLFGGISTTNLADALEALGFLLGVEFRSTEGEKVFLFGGKEDLVIESLPTYGFDPLEVVPALGGKANKVGDAYVLQADSKKASEIREAFKKIGDRESVNFEVVIFDTTETGIDRVNAWLDKLVIAANLTANNLRPVPGLYYDFDVSALFEMLDTVANTRVDLYQRTTVLSGADSEFSTGEIIETLLIIREPETGRDLVSRVERRTVGLVVKVRASKLGDLWHLRCALDNGAIVQGRERSTKVSVEKIIAANGKFFEIATYQAESVEDGQKELPIFSSIPKIGKKWFVQKEAVKSNRQFVVLGRFME